MVTNWTKLGTIFTALSFIVGLVLVIFTIVPPDEIFNNEEDFKNSDINLQKTRPVYFAEAIDVVYLDITSNQPDSKIMFNCPNQLYYGDPTSIILKIDGIGEIRKIKVFLVDPNNIVKFADQKTADFINEHSNNKSLIDSDSTAISINKIIPIQFQIPASSSQISDGTWKLNIIILNENDKTSLIIVKELKIAEKKPTIKFSTLYSIILSLLMLAILVIVWSPPVFRKIFKLSALEEKMKNRKT